MRSWWKRRAVVRSALVIGLLLLGASVTFTLIRAVNDMARIHDDLFASTDLLNVVDDFNQQFVVVEQGLASFMFLGDDQSWHELQISIQKAIRLAERLGEQSQRYGLDREQASNRILTNLRHYHVMVQRLKEIRQAPLGVVSGVIASAQAQNQPNMFFNSLLMSAADGLRIDAEDETARELLDNIRVAHTLWLRAMIEFRAHLLLRDERSLDAMRDYLQAYENAWQRVMVRLNEYPIDTIDLLQQADEHQRMWLAALDDVLAVHSSRRWREDIRYVEDTLRPLDQEILGAVDDISTTQHHINRNLTRQLNKAQNQILYWSIGTLLVVTLLAAIILLIVVRLWREQEARREAAEQANAIKTEFLANVTHELRTPLHPIIGFAELLQDDPELQDMPDVREQIKHIQTSANRLLDLVNAIIDLTMLDANKLYTTQEKISTYDFMQNLVSGFAQDAKENDIEIQYHAATSCPGRVTTDSARLRQALGQIIDNAIKFNQPGGHVWVRCRVGEPGEWVIEIEDDGIGIAAAERDKIFQPFYQIDSGVSRSYEGAGIGLTLARRLLEILGAELSLQVRQGQGSRFIIRLPVECEAVPN